MNFFLVASEDVNIMWFHKKNHKDDIDPREAEIQATRSEIHKKIDEVADTTEKINKILEENGGTTYLIFLATGGGNRGKHGKR